MKMIVAITRKQTSSSGHGRFQCAAFSFLIFVLCVHSQNHINNLTIKIIMTTTISRYVLVLIHVDGDDDDEEEERRERCNVVIIYMLCTCT